MEERTMLDFFLVQFSKCHVRQQVILKYLEFIFLFATAILVANTNRQCVGFKCYCFLYSIHYDYLKILHICFENEGFLGCVWLVLFCYSALNKAKCVSEFVSQKVKEFYQQFIYTVMKTFWQCSGYLSFCLSKLLCYQFDAKSK